MATAPLVETTQFSTTDPEEAREFFAAAYGDNDLRVESTITEGGVLSVDRAAASRVNISDMVNPATLEIAFTGLDDQVIFTTVHEGAGKIDRRDWNGHGFSEMGPGDVSLTIQPDTEWFHEALPNHNTTVGVSESLMREVVGANPSDADLHWEPLSPEPATGRTELWHQTTRFLQQTLNDPAAAQSPLVVSEAERLVASAALTVFPNKLVERIQGRDHEGGSDILRRAIAFIESNPQQDISLAEIAAAAHAGPRAVQVAFRKHMNTTPMAYLRLVRLHHVREDLLRSSTTDGTTVASVCARWGFGNQGRAAELYRAQFGENPSETLRR